MVVHASLPSGLGPYCSWAADTITSPTRKIRPSSVSSVAAHDGLEPGARMGVRMMTEPGFISTTTATGVSSSSASAERKYDTLTSSDASSRTARETRSGALPIARIVVHRIVGHRVLPLVFPIKCPQNHRAGSGVNLGDVFQRLDAPGSVTACYDRQDQRIDLCGPAGGAAPAATATRNAGWRHRRDRVDIRRRRS